MDMAIPKHTRPAYPEPVERGQVRRKLMELLGLEEVPEAADFTVASVETEDGLGGDARVVPHLPGRGRAHDYDGA